MKKLVTTLDIGIPSPIRVVHFSDTHLTAPTAETTIER